MRHFLRVAVIGTGVTLATVLLVRGSLVGGAVGAVISVVVFAGIDWLLGIATGEHAD